MSTTLRAPVEPATVPGIDAGVAKLVEELRRAGFNTTDSGDGAKTGMECALDFPHVFIQSDDSGDGAHREVLDVCEFLKARGVALDSEGAAAPAVELSWRPGGPWIIAVLGVTDDMLEESAT